MFPDLGRQKGHHVGKKNVEAAKRLLEAHGLTCSGAHVEGRGHRNLIFDLWNGHVALKHIPLEPGRSEGKRA